MRGHDREESEGSCGFDEYVSQLSHCKLAWHPGYLSSKRFEGLDDLTVIEPNG